MSGTKRSFGMALVDAQTLYLVSAAPPFPPPVFVGALVRLRSGGPMMRVVNVSGDQVGCVWRAGTAAMYSSFLRCMLDLDWEESPPCA